jgi:hypothetical protein
MKELSLLDDYSGLPLVVEGLLRDAGAAEALDALGSEPTLLMESPNPLNRPMPGLALQRERLLDAARRISDDEEALDSLNAFAKATRTPPAALYWLGYQASVKAGIAGRRVRVERDIQRIIAGVAAGPLTSLNDIYATLNDFQSLLKRAEASANETEPSFNRKDPIRPPAALINGVEIAPGWLGQFDDPHSPLWRFILGVSWRGTEQSLSVDAGVGALGVVMLGLGGVKVSEAKCDETTAAIASAVLRIGGLGPRDAHRRRLTFVAERGGAPQGGAESASRRPPVTACSPANRSFGAIGRPHPFHDFRAGEPRLAFAAMRADKAVKLFCAVEPRRHCAIEILPLAEFILAQRGRGGHSQPCRSTEPASLPPGRLIQTRLFWHDEAVKDRPQNANQAAAKRNYRRRRRRAFRARIAK